MGDYARAYDYWLDGHVPKNATLAQFAAGFADVQTVRALAQLPVRGGVAAGTEYVDVPVVVQTTLKSGGEQIFAGCFRIWDGRAGSGYDARRMGLPLIYELKRPAWIKLSRSINLIHSRA